MGWDGTEEEKKQVRKDGERTDWNGGEKEKKEEVGCYLQKSKE